MMSFNNYYVNAETSKSLLGGSDDNHIAHNEILS